MATETFTLEPENYRPKDIVKYGHLSPSGNRALDASKATQSDVIPTKIIKNNSDIFSRFFQANFTNAIETSAFPEQRKYADVKPVLRKDSQTDKKNYRRICILPNVSKIYERCINKQLEEYFQAQLSKY